MTGRFDLEKWRAELDRAIGNYCGHEDKPENRLPDGDCAKCKEIVDEVLPVVSEAATAAENHQRELMECGHRRACLIEKIVTVPSVGEGDDLVGEIVTYSCTACAELSRVRQQARAEALEQAAADICVYCYEKVESVRVDHRWAHRSSTGEKLHCYAWSIRALKEQP